MPATLASIDRETATFEIIPARTTSPDGYDPGGFNILMNGSLLVNRYGDVRWFATRASARKRITRERRGDFR